MSNNIKEILKESLFFTGAGFSKPAGCKLSSEMLKDLENRSNHESDNNIFTKTERKAIKFILSCLDYQARYRTLESNGKYFYVPNIEEFAQLLRRIKNRENLLPYPVTGNWSDKITIIEQDFKIENRNPETDIWTSIENKIKTKCYNDWLNHNSLDYLKPLEDLLKEYSTENDKLEIFTLNNDLVLETFFKKENSVYTGFVNNKWVGFERKNIDENTYNASRINYYKLHGSIDWVRLTDGTIIKGSIGDNENVEINPFLIFGHGIKIYTIDPFFSLLNYFKEALQDKKYYFIIGYSFFDPHINNLFFNVISLAQDKFMIIVNPKLLDGINQNDFEKQDDLSILKKETKSKVLGFLSNIQKNPIYTEMPDFNIPTISSESFEYIKDGAEDFLGKIPKYFEFVNKLKTDRENKTKLF